MVSLIPSDRLSVQTAQVVAFLHFIDELSATAPVMSIFFLSAMSFILRKFLWAA
jgi:hypothetical protein